MKGSGFKTDPLVPGLCPVLRIRENGNNMLNNFRYVVKAILVMSVFYVCFGIWYFPAPSNFCLLWEFTIIISDIWKINTPHKLKVNILNSLRVHYLEFQHAFLNLDQTFSNQVCEGSCDGCITSLSIKMMRRENCGG